MSQDEIDDAYIVHGIWQYNNKIDLEKLKQAWRFTQAKYASLRLKFDWQGELLQVIEKKGFLDWRYYDLTCEINECVQEIKILEIQQNDRKELYELDKNKFIRVYLIKKRDELWVCMFSSHHAVLDGWSGPVLMNYIHDVYMKLLCNKKILFEVDRSYEEAQKYLQNHSLDNADFWNKYLAQIEERLDLSNLVSIESRESLVRVFEYKHIIEPIQETLIVEGDLYKRLKDISKAEGVTINAILQFVWHKILNIYGKGNQTVVGTVVSGRNIPINNIETAVGLFINTLPLIVIHEFKENKKIIEVIKIIQNDINEINIRSNVNLASLQKNGERLFDTIFVYENYPVPKNTLKSIEEEIIDPEKELKISFIGGSEKLDYPLSVSCYESKSVDNNSTNQIVFRINYAGELFNKKTIDSLLTLAKMLIEKIAQNIYQNIADLNYLDESQYKQTVYEWNNFSKR